MTNKKHSEKLHVKCVGCDGSGKKWQVDIKNIERAARQIAVTCLMCDGDGYMDAGIHTGQVDKLMDDAQAGIQKSTDDRVYALNKLLEWIDTYNDLAADGDRGRSNRALIVELYDDGSGKIATGHVSSTHPFFNEQFSFDSIDELADWLEEWS